MHALAGSSLCKRRSTLHLCNNGQCPKCAGGDHAFDSFDTINVCFC